MRAAHLCIVRVQRQPAGDVVIPLVESDPYIRARVMVLAESIAKQTSISPELQLGRSHLPSIVRARHALMAALWRSGCSTSEVGAILGRDHSTVIMALRKTLGADVYRAELAARRVAA